MARALRISYPDAIYHVTCRGNEQKPTFRNDADRRRFIEMLTESLSIYSVKLLCYVLMSNHFHLIVQTPQANLSAFMRHFNITYTGYYNRRHRRVGHLYQGRYKAILVDKDAYLSVLSRYIHLNPVKITAMESLSVEKKIQYLRQYQWSSLPGYLSKREEKPFVDYSVVLGYYNGNDEQKRKAYARRLNEDIDRKIDVMTEAVGGILGERPFVEWAHRTFLRDKKDRERPAVGDIHRHQTKGLVIEAIVDITGKDITALIAEKGALRQMAMELLYRRGGLKGPEIGLIFGIDYSSVSQERKRFRQKLETDKTIGKLMDKIEAKL